jgi:DNA-binding beta-propeller fold protein YncE
VVDNTASDGRGRITIFDAETLERVGQIQSPDRPPRYIAFASDTKAYVTNLTLDGFTPQPSTVSIVDLEQEVVTDSIDVGVSPEGIAVTAGKAFVANAGGTTLSVIDTEQDAVTTTLDLECSSPNEVFVDQENEVVVVCEGSGEDDAEVLFVDPADVAVTQRVALNGDVGSLNATQSADYAPRAEELYAIDGGGFTASGFQEGGTVYRIDTDANALATTLKVPESNRLVGATAVGYDAIAQRLYVARLPVGEGGGPLFDADGRTVILDRSGAQVGSFEVGNSPAHLFFQRTP